MGVGWFDLITLLVRCLCYLSGVAGLRFPGWLGLIVGMVFVFGALRLLVVYVWFVELLVGLGGLAGFCFWVQGGWAVCVDSVVICSFNMM